MTVQSWVRHECMHRSRSVNYTELEVEMVMVTYSIPLPHYAIVKERKNGYLDLMNKHKITSLC